MNLSLRFGLFDLFLLLAGTAFCHGHIISHNSEELEAVITKMMECHHLPGLAVSVVQGGSVWAKGFGEAVIGNVPFSPDTKVPIGTLANIFTTMVLDQLMVRGGNARYFPYKWFPWLTPVRKVLTKVSFTDGDLNDKLTLEDLAAGRTGLSPLPLLWEAEALPDTLTRSDLVSYFHKIPKFMKYGFRQNFMSNPLAHGLLGRATEIIGNGTWKQLMQDKLLSRLQMHATGFLGDPYTSIRAERGFAIPYEYCPNCPSYFRTRFTIDTPLSKYRLPVIYPESGMVSSAKDMATFLKDFLTNGKVRPILFKSSTFTQRKTNVLPNHPWVVNFKKPKHPVSYKTYSHGKGWFLAQYNGYDVAWNVGKLHNYLTYTAVVKDLDLAMTFFANSAGNDTFSPLLMSYIVDLAAGEPRWFNTSSVCAFRANPISFWAPALDNQLKLWYDATRAPLEGVAQLVGTYRDPLFGEVTVVRKGQTLNATYGRLTGEIEEISGGNFLFSPAGMERKLFIQILFKQNGKDLLSLRDPREFDGAMTFSKNSDESK